MKEYIILTDSSANFLKKEAIKNNIEVLPLNIIFDNKKKTHKVLSYNYLNDYNEFFSKNFDKDKKNFFSTSFFNISLIKNKILELSKNYKKIIYIPIDSNLSSQLKNCSSLQKDKNIKDKLILLDTNMIGPLLKTFIFDLILFLNNDNKNINTLKIKNYIKEYQKNNINFICPENIENLKKTNRLLMHTFKLIDNLNFKLILKYDKKGIYKHKIIRTRKATFNFILKSILNKLQKKNKKLKKIIIGYSCGSKISKLLFQLDKFFQYYKISNTIIKYIEFTKILTIHTGQNTISFSFFY